MDSISVRFPDATWMAIYGCVARQSCCIWDQQSQGTRFSMFMFVTLSCRKSLSENVFKKTACVFFFFEFPSGKKQRWLPGCVLHGCTGQRTTSSWWSFSDRLSFLPDRGFGVSWWITIFPLPTWTESWSVKNQATWERCPCFLGWGGGSNAFSCFTSSSVFFLERIWGSGPYPPWCCSPFEASGTHFSLHHLDSFDCGFCFPGLLWTAREENMKQASLWNG